MSAQNTSVSIWSGDPSTIPPSIQSIFSQTFPRPSPNKYLPSPNVISQINDVNMTMSSGSGNPNVDDVIPSREDIEEVEQMGSSRNILLNAREIVRLIPCPPIGSAYTSDSDSQVVFGIEGKGVSSLGGVKEFNRIRLMDDNWTVDLGVAKEDDEVVLGLTWDGTVNYSTSRASDSIGGGDKSTQSAVTSTSPSTSVSSSSNQADTVKITQRLRDISIDPDFPTEQDLQDSRDEHGDNPIKVRLNLTQDYMYIPSHTDGDDHDSSAEDSAKIQSDTQEVSQDMGRGIIQDLYQKPYFKNELEVISKICSNFPIPTFNTSTNISRNNSENADNSGETGSYVQYKNGNLSTIIRQLHDPSSRGRNSSLYSVEIIDSNRKFIIARDPNVVQ